MPEASRVTDRRLIPAREGLAAGRYRLLSLDVFDTLLWRRVPEPADAFLLLGRALATSGSLAPHVSPQGFADLRRAAERAAREKVQAVTGYREITLASIYEALPDHLFTAGFGHAARIAAELDCERGLLVLDDELVALMKAAKSGGARVILVSDTYFTSGELRTFLAAAGLSAQEFEQGGLVDRLYVSCEAGKPKYRDLFDVVLKDEGVTAEAVIHIGDSLEADVEPARTRGMAFAHYDKWGSSSRMQKVEFPPAREPRARLLGEGGDFGLTGLRARLAHRAPPDLSPDLKPYWIYGAVELAPIFAAFARWVVDASRTVQPAHIFGLMREGRFLKRLVEATARELNTPLAVEELWLSRRAVVRASLYDDDLSLLPEAILLCPGGTTDEILLALGLARADLSAVLPAFDIGQAGALAALSRAIVTTPALKAQVLTASGRMRANLLRGLAKHFDLAKAQRIAFLDLGYAATIQSVLARILAREGAKTQLTGLYLALNEKSMAHIHAGADLRAFLSDEGFQGEVSQLLSRTPDVLEHACMCPEGSLAAYDEAGNPVLLANQRDAAQLAQMEALQDGIMAGVTAVNRLLGSLERTPAAALAAQAARIIQGALVHPTPFESATIGAWRHEANFDLTDLRRLADLAFNPMELEYRGWPALQDLGRHQVYWPAAALTAANPYIGAGFAQGFGAKAAGAPLTAGPLLGGITICPDLGVGFDTKRQGAMPLDVNTFGRGHIQVIVKPFGPDAYRRLRLTWPAVRAVVQIDQIALNYIGESEQRPAVISPPAWSNTTEISSGLHMTDLGKAGEAVVSLGTPPPWAHALELTLRFKYLRLDPMFGAR